MTEIRSRCDGFIAIGRLREKYEASKSDSVNFPGMETAEQDKDGLILGILEWLAEELKKET